MNTRGGKLRLLKSAVIYGANASGKSNSIEALDYMCTRIIFDSLNIADGKTFFQRFRLDKKSELAPSEFEVIYTRGETRYQYGFVLQTERVTEEWLFVYESDKPQKWFSRKISPDTGEDVYEFSSYLKGPKKTWEKTTSKDALFLSVAARLNSEQLRHAYDWFKGNFRFLWPGRVPSTSFYRMKPSLSVLENEQYKKKVQSILLAADIGIQDILITKKPGEREIGLFFSHQTSDDVVELFELEDESLGTQRLFRLSFDILKIMDSGGVLVVDELESSLHPLLLRHVVNLFNSAENKNGAQLIFTTHDAGLLDNKIFRRDQVWFTEKDDSSATVLYPLTDFSPRKEESFASGYLSGRYGAIPFLSDFKMGESGEHDDGE